MEEARALLLENCHMYEKLSLIQPLAGCCARRGAAGQSRHEVGISVAQKRNNQIKGQCGPLSSHSERSRARRGQMQVAGSEGGMTSGRFKPKLA